MTSQKKPSIKTIEREIGKKYLLDLLQNNKKKKKTDKWAKITKSLQKRKPMAFQPIKDAQLSS